MCSTLFSGGVSGDEVIVVELCPLAEGVCVRGGGVCVRVFGVQGVGVGGVGV